MEKTFVQEATEAGFVGLKGHRSAGGIRVSAYNAVRPESIQELVRFMGEFASRHASGS